MAWKDVIEPVLGGGDALLEHAHLLGQGRLVAHGGGHTAEQRGHLGAGQRVAVDVVDEQQHVVAFVAEVLGHGEAGERHAQAVARRLVHLAVHERHLVEHAAVLHLVVEVVAFAGALADAGEHREAAVLGRDVADQLEQRHGLADAGAAEEADLAALGDGHDEVDDLDAGLEQLGRARLVLVPRRRAVDRPALLCADWAGFVDRVPRTSMMRPSVLGPTGHRNRLAGVGDADAAVQAFGGAHGDRAHDAVAELLLHLEGQIASASFSAS